MTDFQSVICNKAVNSSSSFLRRERTQKGGGGRNPINVNNVVKPSDFKAPFNT